MITVRALIQYHSPVGTMRLRIVHYKNIKLRQISRHILLSKKKPL